MMLTLDATRMGIFRRVEFPAALPQIFTGTRVAATYAAIGAVFGEWAGSQSGLGWQMLQAKGRLDTALVFADIVFITVMALGALRRRVARRAPDHPLGAEGGVTVGCNARGAPHRERQIRATTRRNGRRCLWIRRSGTSVPACSPSAS